MSACPDYEEIAVRAGEDQIISRFVSHTSSNPEKVHYDSHSKALALLKAHFSREPMEGHLLEDQKCVLLISTKLLSAMVDVIASEGWVGPLLASMELAQMVIQGMWSTDSPLLQLPHISKSMSENCLLSFGHDSVYGLLDLDDHQLKDVLHDLSDAQITDVAKTCFRYPNIRMNAVIVDKTVPGAWLFIQINIMRDWDIKILGPVPPVDAPRYPAKKREGWWIVGVDNETSSVCFVKKVSLNVATESKGQFLAAKKLGRYKLQLYLMCDSYIGCDQEYEADYNVRDDLHMLNF
jgi:pre-mRNA-splicing helicase BRR2